MLACFKAPKLFFGKLNPRFAHIGVEQRQCIQQGFFVFAQMAAASAVAFVGQLLAGRALRNAIIIEGAEPTPMFTSLRWLGLVFALKAVVVVLTVTTVLLRLKSGGSLL